jgi:hypothetical protein
LFGQASRSQEFRNPFGVCFDAADSSDHICFEPIVNARAFAALIATPPRVSRFRQSAAVTSTEFAKWLRYFGVSDLRALARTDSARRSTEPERQPTAEAHRGRHAGFPRFNVLGAGPGSLA